MGIGVARPSGEAHRSIRPMVPIGLGTTCRDDGPPDGPRHVYKGYTYDVKNFALGVGDII